MAKVVKKAAPKTIDAIIQAAISRQKDDYLVEQVVDGIIDDLSEYKSDFRKVLTAQVRAALKG